MSDVPKSILAGRTAIMCIEVIIPFREKDENGHYTSTSTQVELFRNASLQKSSSEFDVLNNNKLPSVQETDDKDSIDIESISNAPSIQEPTHSYGTSFEDMSNFLNRNCTVDRKLIFVAESDVRRGQYEYRMFVLTCSKNDVDAYISQLIKCQFGTSDGIGVVNVYPLSYQGVGKLLNLNPTLTSENSSYTLPDGDAFSHVRHSTSRSVEIFDPSAVDVAAETEEIGTKEEKLVASSRSKFFASITEKITIYEAFEIVESGAHLTFDFIMFVLVASMLACVGLVTNNTVVIVASMLVSPLMGPILAFTFGTYVRVPRLVRVGMVTEAVGLIMCFFVGFFGGLCSVPALGDNLPTNEMFSRGNGAEAIYVGIAIAIPSGIGVALSVLSDNASSLVGVAISASLLPPAVNTGIFFAIGTLHNAGYMNFTHVNEMYHLEYPEGFYAGEVIGPNTMLTMGGYSLLLTMVNIACIWVTCLVMFWVKEVSTLGSEFVTKEDRETIRHAQELMRERQVHDASEPVRATAKQDNLKLDMSLFHPNNGTFGTSSTRFRRSSRRITLADELFPDITELRRKPLRQMSVLNPETFQPIDGVHSPLKRRSTSINSATSITQV